MVQELTEIFKPVSTTEDLVHFRDFRKLTLLYYCSATKEEESSCGSFLAAHNGRWCFASVFEGQKVCRLDGGV